MFGTKPDDETDYNHTLYEFADGHRLTGVYGRHVTEGQGAQRMTSLGFIRNDCSSKINQEYDDSSIWTTFFLLLLITFSISAVVYAYLKNRGQFNNNTKSPAKRDGPGHVVELPNTVNPTTTEADAPETDDVPDKENNKI